MSRGGRPIAIIRLIVSALFITTILVLLLHTRKSPSGDLVPEDQCRGASEKVAARTESHVIKYNRKLNKEVRLSEVGGAEAVDILFYGDSIVETWRGTDMGRECQRCHGAPEVFHTYFGSRYNCKILAVGADQTSHLQWRLLNGQLMVLNPPKLVVMMIGTNDLGADVSCFASNASYTDVAVSRIRSRIEGIVNFLQNHTPSSRLLLLGLPPRGVWDSNTGTFEHPSVFTSPTTAVNHALMQLAAGREMVSFQDCGGRLLNPDGKLGPSLQEDGLHPTAEGMAILAACTLESVEGLIGPGDRGIPQPHPFSKWLGERRAAGEFWGP